MLRVIQLLLALWRVPPVGEVFWLHSPGEICFCSGFLDFISYGWGYLAN